MEIGILTVVGILLLGLIDFFMKLSAQAGIHPVLGSFLFGISGIFPPAAWLYFLKYKNIPTECNKPSIIYIIIDGFLVGIMDVLWVKVLSYKEASTITPLMRASGLTLLVILSFLILKEKITNEKIAGIVFAVLAIYFLMKN